MEKLIKDNSGYGYRRITLGLYKDHGVVINHKVVIKLLKHWNLQKIRKVRKPKPSPLQRYIKELGARVNLFEKTTNPGLFKVLFTDFTEIKCSFGKIYFIPFIDLKSRRICGWNIGFSDNTDNALSAYVKTRRYLKRMNVDMGNIIIHQDQDRVFTGYRYAGELLNDDVRLSFTEKGFKDNPYIESFFSRFKEEYIDLITTAKDLKEVKDIIKKCVLKWNKSRIHSALQGRSPDEFIREAINSEEGKSFQD